MLILVSNDDGYQARGVRELIKYLLPFGEVIAICPDGPRSGQSMALTFNQALFIKEQPEPAPGVKMYSLNGTPVDCVKISNYTILKGRRPDLVVAGINHGSNAGINVLYSGTMGAVQEACGMGVPAVGFSLCDHAEDADFSPCRPFIETIVKGVIEHGLPEGIFLNVNFPANMELKGMRITTECRGNWSEEYQEYTSPHGQNFYMLSGRFINEEPDNEQTDEWAIHHGYVSVTPEQLNRTALLPPTWLTEI